ncbi:MAG: hypothetical protein GEV11_21100 [Streptosporangiales bacterium]|nr:hypothetical protein [Streptosporangiales bacterium]
MSMWIHGLSPGGVIRMRVEPPFRPDGNRDFRYLIGLLNQPLAALFSQGFSAQVWHCSVRAASEDRFLTGAEWRRIAGMVMDRTGLPAVEGFASDLSHPGHRHV